ncbi:MAG TPA: acyltransferase [Acidimicrobiales bacterium]|jgi:peptidoglycan/LPS O-acetylase OafA/YrhL|nr:acyltransferase [Acidimicrobiales bacterium]
MAFNPLRATAAPVPAPVVDPPGGYLNSLNLFRVVACAAVVGQHAFLWIGASGIAASAFVTLLHFSRTAFFFVSGLVLCYTELRRPLSPGRFWQRRYTQMGVPYVAWTLIYLVFTLLTVGGSWHHTYPLFRHSFTHGYYQLYALIVLFQAYLLFPPLLWLLRRSRRHLLIGAVSVVFALFINSALHFTHSMGFISDFTNWLGTQWPWSRNLLAYQEFFVLGALAAFHLREVHAFVSRWHRQVMAFTGAVAAGMLAWYLVSVWNGTTTGAASDIYQPLAVVWCLVAIAGLYCWSWAWEARHPTPESAGKRRGLTSVAHLAELTAGIYFCHVLFINRIRLVLENTGLRTHLPFAATVGLLFVLTLAVSAAFITLVLRSPLRWVVGGPVRAEQRARWMARADQVAATDEPVLAKGARAPTL